MSVDPVTGMKRPQVLVVDDHPTTRKLMSAWLELSGYQVAQAEDGIRAWSAAEFDCPPIVVTDWNMPEMSGLDLCRSIRAKLCNEHVYILIATSRDSGDDLSEAMAAGANDFLSKPIQEDEFLARIQNAENAIRQLQIQTELAEIDGLTGLLNRRTFVERSQTAIEAAMARNRPASCLMMDIDLFKQYNDEYGHAVGDEVLRLVGSIIKEMCQHQELAGRLGGDEFCLFLTDYEEPQAVQFAEELRNRIASRSADVIGAKMMVRTTMGVSPLLGHCENLTALLEQADRALLAAKSEGRDRTQSYSSLQRQQLQTCDLSVESHLTDLKGTTADKLMTTSIAIYGEQESFRTSLASFLASNADSACVVNQNQQLVGMVSERDYLNAMASRKELDTPLRDLMNCNIARFTPETTADQIWQTLQRTPMLRSVVVDENGVPLGMIERRALLSLLRDIGNI
ncbi:Response regulator PleD [Aureliella helgolandensis]|uniref:diguanylate cyclase n=2 Tax=Aureliella helgolandensis TaxID=2527968 RepID=A0A518G095_9BACT|nr:Response regulator PleD [Aureliella helgolandensis]